MTGDSPTLELLVQNHPFPFAREAGVYIEGQSTLFITSNRLTNPSTGVSEVEITKSIYTTIPDDDEFNLAGNFTVVVEVGKCIVPRRSTSRAYLSRGGAANFCSAAKKYSMKREGTVESESRRTGRQGCASWSIDHFCPAFDS